MKTLITSTLAALAIIIGLNAAPAEAQNRGPHITEWVKEAPESVSIYYINAAGTQAVVLGLRSYGVKIPSADLARIIVSIFLVHKKNDSTGIVVFFDSDGYAVGRATIRIGIILGWVSRVNGWTGAAPSLGNPA